MADSPSNLVWLDLEFTGVEDLDRSHVMQAAMLVTTSDLEPLPAPGADPGGEPGVVHDVRLTSAQAATASEWVRTHQAEQLRRSLESGVEPAEVEQSLIDYVRATCPVPSVEHDDPERQAENPLLAGLSIHMDHALLTRRMPRLVRHFSFRLFDVRTIQEAAERWMPRLPVFPEDRVAECLPPGYPTPSGEQHDALFDIYRTIAKLGYYRRALFVESARG